jgi:molybdenum-dependent DNA-binding transcriptional regulator ModE
VDRFDNMRVFAKVVESGSFTGAEARLGISASMVGQHVKELEERLGARLPNRTTRKVSLTETGRAYYERCTRLLADLEDTEQAVSDMHAIPRGELRVNAAPTFGIVQLAPAIADFTARPPGSLLGPFIGMCQQRVGTPQEILSATDTAELRDLLDYANQFHHDTNPVWQTVTINDSELIHFSQRVMAFTRRR